MIPYNTPAMIQAQCDRLKELYTDLKKCPAASRFYSALCGTISAEESYLKQQLGRE